MLALAAICGPLLLAAPGWATLTAPAPAAAGRTGQTEADEYTRYELLAPDSAQFHILFEVTATSPGATAYFNPIRKGSEASGEAVYDRATGKPLAFAAVSGAEARRSGLPDADLGMSYLRIQLPRPVPAEGGVRLLIDKTYKDPKSYQRKDGGRIVFARPLGVRRNSIVLPAGYELVACNVPAQVLSEPDGRIEISFMHTGPDAAPLVVEARKLPAAAGRPPALPAAAAPPGAAASGSGAVPPGTSATRERSRDERLAERAHQDRTIVYFLRQPESHAFDLYHDYTESRAGTDKYLNVVRKGSTSENPSARNLDTGEALPVETLRGSALLHAGLTAEELREVTGAAGAESKAAAGAAGKAGAGTASPAAGPAAGAAGVQPDTEVVIARFPPVPQGQSLRLRIAETYSDPRSYRLEGDTLVFDRSFGRSRNAVVLPPGWYLTASAIPALVSEAAGGRIRLDWVNPRPDEIAVLIEARRR